MYYFHLKSDSLSLRILSCKIGKHAQVSLHKVHILHRTVQMYTNITQ